MNIDEMPAGIELDILVAEALGYTRITPLTTKVMKDSDPVFMVVSGGSSIGNDRVYIRQSTGEFTYFVPSIDIATAWEVVAQITAAFFLEHPFTVGQSWYVRFENRGDGTWQDEIAVRAVGSTAPLAICRAALKFVEAVDAREAAE